MEALAAAALAAHKGQQEMKIILTMAITLSTKQFRVQIDAERCKGCSLCVDFCPKDVIEMTTDRLNANGVTFAECVHPDQCSGCMSCTVICPDAAIELFRLED
jgi:2-oxoglutarate ferredoxin oxidoreductase subunit delta